MSPVLFIFLLASVLGQDVKPTTDWTLSLHQLPTDDNLIKLDENSSTTNSSTSTTTESVPTQISDEGSETVHVFLAEDFEVGEGVTDLVNGFARSLWEDEVEPEWAVEPRHNSAGRGRKKKRRLGILYLIKALVGLKVALLGIVLPLAVTVAKVMSWKAVTLSLMAFMLAKIVFVKNLFMGKNNDPPASPAPAPIVIHSSPHDHVWKRQSDPQIHVKPEVHVHPTEDHNSHKWDWSSDGRSAQQLAYQGWTNNQQEQL